MWTQRILVFTGLVALAACRDRGEEVAVSDVPLRELEIAPEDTAAPIATPVDSASRPEVRRTQSGGRAAERAIQPKRRTKALQRPGTEAARAGSARAGGAREDSTVIAPMPVDASGVDLTLADSARGDTVPGDTSTAAEAEIATARPAPTDASASVPPVEAERSSSNARPPATPPPATTPSPASTPPANTRSAEPPSVPAPSATPPPPAATGASEQPAAPVAPPAPAGASDAVPPAADMHALPAGMHVRALLQDSIHSLHNSAGQTVTALVSGDMRAPDGRTLVPSGSAVRLTITRLKPARTRNAVDGELELRADSVVVGGRAYPIHAEVQPVPHELKGRGVDAGAAEKVAAGAAVGAVAGGVITGKTKGAVVGGVVGAAGGAVVAAHTASRDVVVTPRTLVVLTLTSPFTGGARLR